MTLGYGTSAGYETAPRLLEAIARRLPELEVSARVMATAEILDAVGDGAIDAGLVRCPPARDGLEAHVVRREPQGVLLRRDHALADGRGGRAVGSWATSRCCCTRARPTRATTTPCSPSAARPASSRRCSSAARRSTSPRRPVVEGRAVAIVGESSRTVLPAELTWRALSPPAALEVAIVARAQRALARPRARCSPRRAEVAAQLGWLDGHAAPA